MLYSSGYQLRMRPPGLRRWHRDKHVAGERADFKR
ncbi:hypothetical protein P4N66_gene4954 [Pseudomonas aeruginosa]|nr:hypothetical protein P4N66_gene4954 [Pseudomonas aeruginosa]